MALRETRPLQRRSSTQNCLAPISSKLLYRTYAGHHTPYMVEPSSTLCVLCIKGPTVPAMTS
eukprot:50870-Eustigmatos_ZCMA.PRE.1